MKSEGPASTVPQRSGTAGHKARLRRTLSDTPLGALLSLSAVVLGFLALVMGAKISQGMTVTLRGAAPAIAHTWGALFGLGGVLHFGGIYSRRLTWELPGLWLVAGGFGFYSVTVLAGLKSHGIAAGIVFSAIAAGCALRAHAVSAGTRAHAQPPAEKA